MIRRALFLLCAFATTGLAQKQPLPPAAPLNLAQAEKEGLALVAEILAQKPAENFTNTGVMKIRDAKGKRTEFSLTFKIIGTPTNWLSIYETVRTNDDGYTDGNYLRIVHSEHQLDEYTWNSLNSPDIARGRSNTGEVRWTGTQWICPFSDSDFWAVDLGLEFLHWPAQRLLKTEMIRSRSCRVLESVNPEPAPAGYSRVKSWIDIESNGILHAEAYDSRNRILKEFDPNVKKAGGQWQLSEMEMINRQTGSRTKIEFDLDAK